MVLKKLVSLIAGMGAAAVIRSKLTTLLGVDAYQTVDIAPVSGVVVGAA